MNLSKLLRNGLFWTAIFTLLCILALDLGFGFEESIGPLGLPGWVYYLIALQMLFALLFGVFIRSYWKARSEGER